MKNLFEFALAGLLFLGILLAPAVAGGEIVRVMTRNQYLGADLTTVFAAETPEEFLAEAAIALAQIEDNDLPLRASRPTGPLITVVYSESSYSTGM